MSKVYDTEIISVGTELLLGHVTNTDSKDISEMLSKIGINVKYHTVVGDNPQRLRDCVEIARNRVDIIITTGGLGPTCDDLTKQILAESFGLKLVENSAEHKFLEGLSHYGRKYAELNYRQAMLPEGCTVFHNDWGTAPGCAFKVGNNIVIMLPGPPKECNSMFKACVVPYLRELSDEKIVSHSVRVFGMGESEVNEIFESEMNEMTNPTMAPYAKECDCLLQITAKAKSEAEAEAMIAPVMRHVTETLGEVVYGIDVESVEERVHQLLDECGKTFALAESCTGGQLAERYTELPGASRCFLGGVVTYTNEAKEKLLGIDPALIAEKTAVSREVAVEMAERVRSLLGADIGIGVTGLAGPDGDGVNPVGRVFVAMAVPETTYVKQMDFGDRRTRSFVRRMTGNIAFDMIRRYVTGMNIDLKR